MRSAGRTWSSAARILSWLRGYEQEILASPDLRFR